MRILVAGVGNVLRGDDAFGIEVLRRLQELPAMEGVRFFESGIAGISLVQELMDNYDALLIIDALDRGAEPGRVFVLQPDEESLVRGAAVRESTDLHQADPEAVLRMARAIKVLPPRVWIIGCQAVGCDDLGAPLSDPVARAVPLAVQRVQEIVESLTREEVCHAGT
ncbi:hydrogenase maturation protease [soil metagenome]